MSRGLGVIRDFIFSKVFGTGTGELAYNLDAYFVAFRVPDFVYTMIIFGAMSAAFIPIYKSFKDQNDADLFASRALNLLLVFVLFFSGLFWLLAPELIPLLAPGFDSEVHALATKLTRIMLLSPIFLGLSSVFQGIENSHKTFWGIALAPIVYNLSIICAAYIFGDKYGVYALAWGVAFGAFLHLLVQVPGAIYTGFRYRLNFNFNDEGVISFVKLTIPRLFGISIAQISLLVDTLIASTLALGSISVYNYALNLQSLPHGVVAVSMSVAVFASLSENVTAERLNTFIQIIKKSTSNILFWVIPAVLGIFLTKDLLVNIVLRGGSFTANDAVLTIETLGTFIWASLGMSLIPLFARCFYSLKDTKGPVIIAFASMLLNISISLVLTQYFHLPIWALAISACVSQSFNAILLIVYLSKKLSVSILAFFESKQLTWIIVHSGVMALVVNSFRIYIFPNDITELFTVSLLGVLIYFGLHRLTKTIPALREV